jgi:hypothetical protein
MATSPSREYCYGKSSKSRAERLGQIRAVRGVLNKLMAVQTDLEPACGLGAETAQVVATPDAIADACDILRSVIADVATSFMKPMR